MKTNQKPEMVLHYPEDQAFFKATIQLKGLLPSFPLDLPSPLLAFPIGNPAILYHCERLHLIGLYSFPIQVINP